MKILKIIHTPGHGGAENTFRRLAWGLRQQGIEVIAAIPAVSDQQAENWIAPALAELNVPSLTFDCKGSPWQMIKNLSGVIDEVRPDLVHAHLLDSNFYSGLVCRLRSIPHISTEHGDVSLSQSFSKRIKYRTISVCSQTIVCVSRAVQAKMAARVFFKNRLQTIYNGIQFLEVRPSTFRNEFGIPEDSILIGNVGNLYPVKGQKYLIRAFAQLHANHQNIVLALVGRGDQEESLRRLVAELNLPKEKIIFTGFRNDVGNVMNAFDLYVQSSLSEGHPLAVLEAMSLGIPIITTAVGGSPEVTAGERYGTLVTPGESSELAAKMQDFINHREQYLEKAATAKRYARHEFSIEKMVEKYISCYHAALGSSKG